MSHVHLACGTGYPVQGSVLIDPLWVALIEREEEVVRQERAFFNYTNEIQSKKLHFERKKKKKKGLVSPNSEQRHEEA